jgi:hypothetical protein
MEKPDIKVGNFLNNFGNKINQKMVNENEKKSPRTSGDNKGYNSTTHDLLYEVLDRLEEMQSNIREIVQEELNTLLEHATIITEGEGDTVQILVGGTHLKGTMRVVKK